MSTAFKWRHKVLASLGTWQLCFQVLLKGRRNVFCSVCIKAAISRTKQYPATRRGEFFKAFGRYPRNQCKEVDQRGRNKQQVPVLVLRQTARTVSLVMPSMKTEGISSQILPVLSQDTVLCTDSYREYKTVSTLILKRFGTSALYPQEHAQFATNLFARSRCWSVYFVSHDTGEREPDRVCHSGFISRSGQVRLPQLMSHWHDMKGCRF